MCSVSDNYTMIKKDIEELAASCGKKNGDVTLIAVTKTMPPSVINEAIEAGALNIGENKAQELVEKYTEILKPPGLKIHFIGHLQTNKVKYIVDKVDMIHSVDSMHLLTEINRQCEKTGKMMDILIQVNTAEDENKFGIRPEELDRFLHQANRFKNISIKGLMTIGRQFAGVAETRRSFQALHKLFVDTKGKKYDNINMIFLSMGMSADYKIAVQEGSNMVRIGTSIFGKRK